LANNTVKIVDHKQVLFLLPCLYYYMMWKKFV
jgi:hypothetical protein